MYDFVRIRENLFYFRVLQISIVFSFLGQVVAASCVFVFDITCMKVMFW